ncbi:MAG: cell division protein FtsZ [Prevotella sp.]|nr:cell division protein FtsZ [Prevotella sp.]MCD8305260.1 cell division protein FtsZ [Prevotella sp.]
MNTSFGTPLNFGDSPRTRPSIIKVVGVGGGGGNAVNHMYRNGIHDVSFLLCNTDSQALENSPVPLRLQLGKEGLGAGDDPEKGRKAAEESVDEIKRKLDDGTRMVFITAGMGGGTGTGAAPVIARISKELDILTIGIVTIPFRFEGTLKIDKALDGVEEMSKHVDALLVINNERLYEVYPNLPVIEAFDRANDTLNVAAKSIAEIITEHKLINLDFNDVRTVLKDGGVAIMSTGYGEGEGRVAMAIKEALNSPLLNDNDIYNSKKILLNIGFSDAGNPQGGLMIDEMNDVNEFMGKFKSKYNIKWGLGVDNSLGEKVKVTILATGFGITDVDLMEEHLRGKITQDEANKRAEADAREAEREERMKDYYGSDSGNALRKRRPQIFIFRQDDLDNDDIISAVESVPTAKRTQSMLKGIRTQTEDKPDDEALATGGQQVISFNTPKQ